MGMHTGVNTGVVLTSESVLDGKQTGPLGDTINVAARLEQHAGPGEILLGDDDVPARADTRGSSTRSRRSR